MCIFLICSWSLFSQSEKKEGPLESDVAWENDSLDLIEADHFKLMKGKAIRKHSLHEKTAASVLLKLFVSGNEW